MLPSSLPPMRITPIMSATISGKRHSASRKYEIRFPHTHSLETENGVCSGAFTADKCRFLFPCVSRYLHMYTEKKALFAGHRQNARKAQRCLPTATHPMPSATVA